MHDAPGSRRHQVLVVEDSDDDFDTIAEAAHRAHAADRLVRATDADAARHLLTRDSADSFAFMLLDYDLPGVDGLALLQQVRHDPWLARLPAVVFTTSVNPWDRDAFYDAGANAYHIKNVRYADCLRTLGMIFDYWLEQVVLPGERGRSGQRRSAP